MAGSINRRSTVGGRRARTAGRPAARPVDEAAGAADRGTRAKRAGPTLPRIELARRGSEAAGLQADPPINAVMREIIAARELKRAYPTGAEAVRRAGSARPAPNDAIARQNRHPGGHPRNRRKTARPKIAQLPGTAADPGGFAIVLSQSARRPRPKAKPLAKTSLGPPDRGPPPASAPRRRAGASRPIPTKRGPSRLWGREPTAPAYWGDLR